MLTKCQGLARFPWLGHTSERHHEYTHGQVETPRGMRILRDICRWHVEEFAYLIGKLKSIPEGDGTLLDNTCLLFVHEHAEANSHKNNNLAVIVAGHAGGLKTGLHTRTTGTLGDLYLTLAEEVMQARSRQVPNRREASLSSDRLERFTATRSHLAIGPGFPQTLDTFGAHLRSTQMQTPKLLHRDQSLDRRVVDLSRQTQPQLAQLRQVLAELPGRPAAPASGSDREAPDSSAPEAWKYPAVRSAPPVDCPDDRCADRSDSRRSSVSTRSSVNSESRAEIVIR